MNARLAEVERLLGAPVPDATEVRHHVFTPGDDTDYRVSYATFHVSPERIPALWAASGLTTEDTEAYTRVALPGGWSTEPADPPIWWPAAPAALEDQRARILEPDGWVAVGHDGGTVYVLATEIGEAPEPPS